MGDFARLHEVHVVPTEPVLDRDEQFVVEPYYSTVDVNSRNVGVKGNEKLYP